MKNFKQDGKRLNAAGTDRFMTGVFYGVGGLFLLLLLVLAGYILYQGITSFDPKLLQFNGDGIGNQFFNTVYLVVLSLLISVPLGIASGIYMAEYAKQGKVTNFIRVCIETLSSLPSIVVGLFGYLVFILMTGAKWNLMAGAQAVSILSLPLITTTTEDALRALPQIYKEGGISLGATRWQTMVGILLPACFPTDHHRDHSGGRQGLWRGGGAVVHRRPERQYQLVQLGPFVPDLPIESLPPWRNSRAAHLGDAH